MATAAAAAAAASGEGDGSADAGPQDAESAAGPQDDVVDAEVVEDEERGTQPAPGLEHPAELGQGQHRVGDRAQRERRQRGVAAVVGEREVLAVEAEKDAVRLRQEDLETEMIEAPSVSWPEAAEKARYLIGLLSGTTAARGQSIQAAGLEGSWSQGNAALQMQQREANDRRDAAMRAAAEGVSTQQAQMQMANQAALQRAYEEQQAREAAARAGNNAANAQTVGMVVGGLSGAANAMGSAYSGGGPTKVPPTGGK